MVGKITTWVEDKGFGFIGGTRGTRLYAGRYIGGVKGTFVHISNLEYKEPKVGDIIQFVKKLTDKGEAAFEVKLAVASVCDTCDQLKDINTTSFEEVCNNLKCIDGQNSLKNYEFFMNHIDSWKEDHADKLKKLNEDTTELFTLARLDNLIRVGDKNKLVDALFDFYLTKATEYSVHFPSNWGDGWTRPGVIPIRDGDVKLLNLIGRACEEHLNIDFAQVGWIEFTAQRSGKLKFVFLRNDTVHMGKGEFKKAIKRINFLRLSAEQKNEMMNVLLSIGFDQETVDIAVSKGLFYASKNEAMKNLSTLLKYRDAVAGAQELREKVLKQNIEFIDESNVDVLNKEIRKYVHEGMTKEMTPDEILKEVEKHFGMAKTFKYTWRKQHTRTMANGLTTIVRAHPVVFFTNEDKIA